MTELTNVPKSGGEEQTDEQSTAQGFKLDANAYDDLAKKVAELTAQADKATENAEAATKKANNAAEDAERATKTSGDTQTLMVVGFYILLFMVATLIFSGIWFEIQAVGDKPKPENWTLILLIAAVTLLSACLIGLIVRDKKPRPK